MNNDINLQMDKKSQMLKRSKAIRKRGWTITMYVLLLLIGLLCAGPFLWLIATSFKGNENIYELTLWPSNPTFANYTGVVEFLSLPLYVKNTLIITFSAIGLDVLFASLCAYPLAKMDFYGKKFVTTALISTMILPSAASMVVNYLTLSKLGLLQSYLGAILPDAVSVFSIILIRQAYTAIPKDMLEAARIDGASEMRIWSSIMIPSVLPAISTVIIIDFINKWNTFLWPMIVLKPDQYPIAAALKFLGSQFSYNFGYIAAGTVLSILPSILVFVMFQKYYTRTMGGAVKG